MKVKEERHEQKIGRNEDTQGRWRTLEDERAEN